MKKTQKEKTNSSEKRNSKAPAYKLPDFQRVMLSPRSDQELDCIAHDLRLWAQQDDSIVFEGFVELSGIVKTRLYDYAKRHEGVREAIEFARDIVGQRRERRALENKYNASIVMGTMALYNQEYRAYRKELAQKETETGSGTKYILVEKFPESELVPEKQSEHRDDDQAE